MGLAYRLHSCRSHLASVSPTISKKSARHDSAADRRRGSNDRVRCDPAVSRDSLWPTPLAVGVDEPDYALWLDWLHRSEATLTFPLAIIFRYSQLEPEEREVAAGSGRLHAMVSSRLRHLTRALGDREWLCAGRFTMADLCVGYALCSRDLEPGTQVQSEISAYWNRLAARPGFIAA